MRLHRALKQYGLVLLAVPGLLLLTGISTLADASPSPSGPPSASGSAALPGDPTNGQTVYAQNCATCHGASLEGGIGAVLNPIDKLPGVPNSLDPAFLIDIITNGRTPQPGDPKQVQMPAWKATLTPKEIQDVAAYVIQQNQTPLGSGPLAPGEQAKRTILWVSVGILTMIFLTYLLAQYNMRWIARRATARRR
jgi:mono/diheme cytochrome c family protein